MLFGKVLSCNTPLSAKLTGRLSVLQPCTAGWTCLPCVPVNSAALRRSLLLSGLSSSLIFLMGGQPALGQRVEHLGTSTSGRAAAALGAVQADITVGVSERTGATPEEDSRAATKCALLQAVTRGRSRKAVQTRQLRTTSVPNGLVQQDLEYLTDDGPQGWVPLMIIAPAAPPPSPNTRPVIVFLHATGNDKNSMRPRMLEYAAHGYITAAIDCRYHGERAKSSTGEDARTVYQSALVRAWREGPERPFLLDNIWDLLHLLDYLETREDVDAGRIGMTGVSLGGMHTWLCATLDERISVAAPVIGVQSFSWAVENESFMARVESIPNVFIAAAEDLKSDDIDARVVQAVWDRIVPGLLTQYDADKSLPCIAPRPLLVLNGALDPRCPVEGLKEKGLPQTEREYKAACAGDKFKVLFEPGVGHRETEEMRARVRGWFDKYLLHA